MCIIAYRPENKTISEKTLKTMFENNPDGAGLMYASGGKIYIEKGFFTKESFIKAYQAIPADVPCVIHCRIATHGSVRAGTCHPFPVTQDAELLNAPELVLSKGFAVAHNGIIYGMDTSNDFSDSQAYVRDVLTPLSKARSLHSKAFKTIIEKTIDNSRLCILSTSGKVSLFGSGWKVENGIFYSNTSYKPVTYSYSGWHWDSKRKAYVNNKGKTWGELAEKQIYDDFSVQETLNCHNWGEGF